MRKSRVFAFVVASLVSTATVAQGQQPVQAGRPARGEVRGGFGGGRHAGGALRGIALTDAEKASLKALRGKYADEGKKLRESLKPAMQEARAARQKGDTVALKAVWERNKGSREQVKALRDRRMADIRAALTPEHQKQFDANLAQHAERQAKRAKEGGKGRHGHNGARKGRRAATNG